MKKILLFVSIIFLLTLFSPSQSNAYIGQCCNEDLDCDQTSGTETCTGPFNYWCDPLETSTFPATCEIENTVCEPDGTPCDPFAVIDPCCNPCQIADDLNYYCGEVDAPQPPADPGTMECVAGSVPGTTEVICTTTFGGDNCSLGYTFDCSKLSQDECAGIHECYLESTPIDPFEPQLCPPDCPPGLGTEECLAWYEDYPHLNSSIGCLPTHPISFLLEFREIIIGTGVGVAFLMLLIGAFFVLTSRGNKEQLQRGKEIIIGAIIGLLFIVFSTFLLELVGVSILGLFI